MWKLSICFFSAFALFVYADYSVEPYPNNFGAQITNLNISKLLVSTPPDSKPSPELLDLAAALKRELHAHRYLHFPGQSHLPWQAQLSFMQLFGDVVDESSHVNRRKFHGEKDPRVAVFSNNPEYGLPSVGVEGFHSDGNVMPTPHAATLLFCEHTIPHADTILSPLNEVASELLSIHSDSFPFDLKDVLFASSHVENLTQPLIYPHPLTGKTTMFFGLGTLSGRYHLTNGTVLSQEWTDSIISAIDDVITRHTVNHVWEEGDLVMLDNLALAHKASPGTQASDGIRILRRVTLKGSNHLQHRPKDGFRSFPHKCNSDGTCLVSLADWVGYEEGSGKFHSNSEAGDVCKVALSPDALLATIHTPMLASLARDVVERTKKPHWIKGIETAGIDTVNWGEGISDTWGTPYPWDSNSGQPNDCDGPGTEPCIFIGPGGRWFDFACAPKFAEGTTTPGPEITWDGKRAMYNIHPLCAITIPKALANEL
mmetsp:Transcript_18251/g.37956  ORF Transcript_18251/g.37956 Transcript_18251/m.37956 type:complete len:484 (-) Transcript_18251:15-1466(-)